MSALKGTRGKWTGILTVLILCVFFAFAGEAQAQGGGVFGSGGASANEGPFEFEFDGGVKVLFDELKQGSGNWQNYFYVAFTATSLEDTVFRISRDNCIAYDNRGNEFSYYGRWIGNRETFERRIIAGVPTSFGFWFRRENHELADIYPRIDVNIMGKVITMRNVPSTK